MNHFKSSAIVSFKNQANHDSSFRLNLKFQSKTLFDIGLGTFQTRAFIGKIKSPIRAVYVYRNCFRPERQEASGILRRGTETTTRRIAEGSDEDSEKAGVSIFHRFIRLGSVFVAIYKSFIPTCNYCNNRVERSIFDIRLFFKSV